MNTRNLTHLTAAALLAVQPLLTQAVLGASPAGKQTEPIPMDQLGAAAGKQYQGDGLSVTATPAGARLRCVFQRLEGEVTDEGLWLSSTAEGAKGERFRVVAVGVGRSREGGRASPRALTSSPLSSPPLPNESGLARTLALPGTGKVEVADQVARFVRPGLTEEYSVSVDGVRQDFVVWEWPAGAGPLRVDLEITGARAEPLVNGARLVLDGSGRKLAYSRLRAVDATGKELPAKMEVQETSAFSLQPFI